jgi:hypothetical protein
LFYSYLLQYCVLHQDLHTKWKLTSSSISFTFALASFFGKEMSNLHYFLFFPQQNGTYLFCFYSLFQWVDQWDHLEYISIYTPLSIPYSTIFIAQPQLKLRLDKVGNFSNGGKKFLFHSYLALLWVDSSFQSQIAFSWTLRSRLKHFQTRLDLRLKSWIFAKLVLFGFGKWT